jgi:hypothetical protein
MIEPKTLPASLIWIISLGAVGATQLCVGPVFLHTVDQVQRAIAAPTSTPVGLQLANVDGNNELAGRLAYYRWLHDEKGVEVPPDPDLESKAYYLVGEAPRLRETRDWPQWYGLRYAVGPVSGEWGVYWPGCDPCPPPAVCYPLPSAPRKSMATTSYPGLDHAARMGAGAEWRGNVQYVAVVWPGVCPAPQPLPTPGAAGSGESGW